MYTVIAVSFIKVIIYPKSESIIHRNIGPSSRIQDTREDSSILRADILQGAHSIARGESPTNFPILIPGSVSFYYVNASTKGA